MRLNKYFALPAVVAAVSLAACGGGGAGPVPATPAPVKNPIPQGTATSSVSFRIPIGNLSGVRTPSVLGRNAHVRPSFIDGNSNGAISVYFDGLAVIPNVDFSATNGAPGAGPSGSMSMPNGGTFSYTSTIAYGVGSDTSNQLYVTVNGTYSTYPGVHTIGVVQTNGACVGTDPCLANNAGYVLAEGQTTLNLNAGDNGASALYVKGVMESAFICDFQADGVTPLCDGGVGTINAGGAYPLYVVVADENGTSIPYQTDGSGNPIPFANGSYQIAETDASGVVTITQPKSTYSVPGTYRHGLYGEYVTVKCNKVGTTTIAAELVPGGPSAGSVTGFNYTAQNYPAAASVLGSTGADEYYGGTMAVNCNSNGTITIQ